ncbi:hypothetical protein YC2023_061235 [Brassica napus]
MNVENFSGCKEESFKEIPPDNLLLLGESNPKMVRTEPTRSMKDHPMKEIRNAKVKSRGVILSYLLKEEPPDAQSIPKPKQYQGRTNESYKLIVVPKKEPDPKLSHEPTSKWKPKSEQSIVQVPKPMNVEIFSDCKEESFKEIPPDNLLLLGESNPKMVRTEPTRSMKDHPLKEIRNAKVKSRGVILSYLLKEEPPDAQSIPKPKQYQGRKNESYKLIVVPKKEPDPKLSHEPTSKWKPKSEQSIVQVPKPMNVENFSGCKEESFKEIPPDNLLLLGESNPKMVRTEPTRSLKDHPLKEIRNAKVKSRGVILSYLLKEEPPDAQSIPKPKQYQDF